MSDSTTAPHVYRAIANVTGELSKEGIGKDRKAEGGNANYRFRGIDDVYNALAPLLAKHRLCILPRVKSRTVTERVTQKGTTLFYVVVDVDFLFVSAEDGSTATVSTQGESMDSGDKATNKAMSAAYKYAALMTFAIPTEGTGKDVEEENGHEVEAPPPRITDGPHPSWDKAESASFTGALRKHGIDYAKLADWLNAATDQKACIVLESLGNVVPSRPAQWPVEYRKRLFAMVEEDAGFFRTIAGVSR